VRCVENHNSEPKGDAEVIFMGSLKLMKLDASEKARFWILLKIASGVQSMASNRRRNGIAVTRPLRIVKTGESTSGFQAGTSMRSRSARWRKVCRTRR